MADWLIFIRERIPLVSYVVLAGGISSSGMVLSRGGFEVVPALLSAVGLLIFFVVLRLMDEYKDYEKDLVAHPERPLPRGLLTKSRVLRAIHFSMAVMGGYSALSQVTLGIQAGFWYLLLTAYLWLMFKEFFVGEWLSGRPLLYALSHQVILIPCCFYALAGSIGDPAPWFLSMMVLGAFFAYEVCRKLDPEAHPILSTYLSYYGRIRTSGLVVVAMTLAAAGAGGLGLVSFLAPIQVILVSSLGLLFLAPKKYKIIEAVASISLIVHLWALPTRFLLESTGILS